MKAPRAVVEAIEDIRQSARCNMLDRNCVQVEADRIGAYATVIWIEDVGRGYGRAIMEGLEAEEDAGHGD